MDAQNIEVVEAGKKSLIELGVTDTALDQLRKEYGKVPDMETSEGYAYGTDGLKQIRRLRLRVEKRRTELKKPLLDEGRRIDGEAKRITQELKALEDPLKLAKEEVDQRKERELEALREKERKRQEAIEKRITAIQSSVIAAAMEDSTLISQRITAIEGLGDEFFAACEERREEAQSQRALALEQLHKLYERASQAEEFKRRQEEFAQQKKDMEEEQRRQEEQARKLKEERVELQRLKQEEEHKLHMQRTAKARDQEQHEDEKVRQAAIDQMKTDAQDENVPPAANKFGALPSRTFGPSKDHVQEAKQASSQRKEAADAIGSLLWAEATSIEILMAIINGKIPWVKWVGWAMANNEPNE